MGGDCRGYGKTPGSGRPRRGAGGGHSGAQPASAAPANPGGIQTPAVAASMETGSSPVDVFEMAPKHQMVRWRTTGGPIVQRESLGGYATDGVATVLNGTQDMVFVRGRDGAVWFRERTGNGA
jgi:hypothetical protein